jgi:hypothetical protein
MSDLEATQTDGSIDGDVEGAPNIMVMSRVHGRFGSRPATTDQLRHFDEMYGPSPRDDEG